MPWQADWSQLGGLIFVARRLVEGLWAGRHASVSRGPGLEFHDYRAYVPGDALADLDWKVYGRTDRLYLRRHRQRTDLKLHLAVDASASMDFAGVFPDRQSRPDGDAQDAPETQATKFRYAQSLAAALALLAIRQSDRVGLSVFSDRVLTHLPGGGAWPHLQRICAALEKAGTEPGEGGLAASLQQVHALLPQRSLLVLIGDLLDDPAALFEGLSRFRHDRREVIIFQVLHPQELTLAGLEGVRLRAIDSETGDRLTTDFSRVRKGYDAALQRHLHLIASGCAARGVDYNLLTTDMPIATALRRYLARRQAAR